MFLKIADFYLKSFCNMIVISFIYEVTGSKKTGRLALLQKSQFVFFNIVKRLLLIVYEL